MLRKILCQDDVLALESTPLHELNLAQNTYAVFKRSAKTFANHPALRFLFTAQLQEQPIDYTYADLFKKITQTANALTSLGVQAGEVVSLLLPNLPQTHFALWGAEAAAIANPINPLLEAQHIIGIMNAAKTKVLVTLAPFVKNNLFEKAMQIAKQVPTLKAILTVDMSQFIPGMPKSTIEPLNEILLTDFDELISKQDSTHLISGREIQPDDYACYFHTGGTTGVPKLAIHSHLNQVFSAWLVGLQLHWDANDVVHCALPLFHVNAPLITGLAPFTSGATVLMTSPQGFRSDAVVLNFWKLIEQYRITSFMAVPTVYRALCHTWTPEADTSSLRYAACGAAPMPVSLINEFKERTGISIIEGYGLTEGTVFSSVNPPFGEQRVGSIGIRNPYQAMKVVKLNEEGQYERDCEPNEIGALVINGPNVFQGYLEEENNESAWIDGQWFNTGDLGRQDEDGYFWLTGRSKDIIIRGGHNIDPRLIEEAMSQHPAVAIAAAVGQPHSKLGELPVAYVSLREGMQITEDALLAYAKANISEKAAVPVHVYILKEIPLTAVGKIFKPALRADAIERVYNATLAPLKEEGLEYTISLKPSKQHGHAVHILFNNERFKSAIERLVRGFPLRVSLQMG